MDKGILIIAVGHANYGKLAANLAMSIKGSNCTLPIHLVYTESTLKGVGEDYERFFDTKAECPAKYLKNKGEDCFIKVKAHANDLSPFKETLFLDADIMLLSNNILEMSDYIKNNSKRCVNEKKCACKRFQSYDAASFGQNVKICTPISCYLQKNCSINQYKFDKYVLNQQDTYALMRRFPEKFPLIPSSQYLCYTPQQQRYVSNRWYRQFGTSQALPANDNWGGFYVAGSEVPYTN